MEKGTVICLAQKRSGVSAKTGNPWVIQTVVIERDGIANEWEKYYCFDVFGEENIAKFNVGQYVEVNVGVYATENKEKGTWFNNHRYLPPRQESVPTPQPQVQAPQPTTQAPPVAQPQPQVTYAQPYVQPQPQPQPQQTFQGTSDNNADSLPF